jgi:uracil-DNA glycosylase
MTETSSWANFTEFDLTQITDPTWHSILLKHQVFLQEIADVLRKEHTDYEGYFDIFPAPDMVFNALKQTPFDQVKVVLFGQDPFFNKNQAMGLCFSVPVGTDIPPSLHNIYKELASDHKLRFTPPTHGNLTEWAKQGVLMLNTSLTVRQGKAGSHAAFKIPGKTPADSPRYLRWRDLIDDIVRAVNSKKDHVVWMLWGTPAKSMYGSQRTSIRAAEIELDKQRHLVLEATHPSPLGANQGGWFGCRHFGKCNEYLQQHGIEPIDWRLN